jgi:hypothetical protein
MGIYENPDAAVKSAQLEETFTPNNHNTYKKYVEIFERLGIKFFEEFEAIDDLQQGNS